MSTTYEILAEWEDAGGRGLGGPRKHALVKVTETQELPSGEPENPEVNRHVYVEELDFADRSNWRRMVDKELTGGLLKRAIEHVSKRPPA